MMLSFHKTDLVPGAPRFLPYPLVVAALSLGAGLPLESGVASFLQENGVDTDIARSRWYFEIWHRGDVDEIAARASFAWQDGIAITEAVNIEPHYQGLNLEPYLLTLGHGLWGAGTVGNQSTDVSTSSSSSSQSPQT